MGYVQCHICELAADLVRLFRSRLADARRRGDRTLELFAVPAPSHLPGSLNVAATISRLLTGDPITENMINSWTAETKKQWRFPLQYLPAFGAATNTHAISHFVADKCGGTFLAGVDVLQARLGSKLAAKKRLEEEIRGLQKRIGESA